jgi:hypothetical protein
VAYSAPFAIYITFLVVESLAGRFFAGPDPAIDLRWLYAVKVGCVALALALFWRQYEELALRHWPGLGECLVAVGAGLLVLAVWVHLDQPWATLGAGKGFDPTARSGEFNWPLIMVRTLGAALVVPVMEELFWRSFIMRWLQQPAFLALRPRAVGVRALVLSSIIFGFEHSLWLAGIVAGLAYAWLYVRSANLWVPVLAHAATNGGLAIWVVATQNWQFW